MKSRRVGAALAALLIAVTGVGAAGAPATASAAPGASRIDPTAPVVPPELALLGGKGEVRLLNRTPEQAVRLAAKGATPSAGATGPGASLAAVTCYVGGSGPRRYSSDTVSFNVTMTCDGAIRQATMYLYMFRNVAGDWSPFASRGPDSAVGTPFIVGLNRTDAVCLPAEYIGVAHVIVDFRDGYPLRIEAIFQTPSIYVGC